MAAALLDTARLCGVARVPVPYGMDSPDGIRPARDAVWIGQRHRVTAGSFGGADLDYGVEVIVHHPLDPLSGSEARELAADLAAAGAAADGAPVWWTEYRAYVSYPGLPHPNQRRARFGWVVTPSGESLPPLSLSGTFDLAAIVEFRNDITARGLAAVRVQVRTFTTLSDITDWTDIAHLVIDDRTLKLRGTKPIHRMPPRSLTTPQNAAMEGHSAMDSAHESETFGDTTESVVLCTPPRYATDRGEVGWEEDWGYVSVGPADTEDPDSPLTVSVDLDDVDDGMPPEVARRLAAVIAAACDAANGTPLGWTQYRAESPTLGEPDPHNAGMVVVGPTGMVIVGPGYSVGPTMLAETFDLAYVRDFYTDKRGEGRSVTIYRRVFRTLTDVTLWEPLIGEALTAILTNPQVCEVS